MRTIPPGGVLRCISDGDVQSPFLGLKFCSDFFWVRDFGKDFFGGLTKSETQGSDFYVKQLYQFHFTNVNYMEWTQKLSGILLNYYYYYFNWTFFGLRSGPLDFFWARV